MKAMKATKATKATKMSSKKTTTTMNLKPLPPQTQPQPKQPLLLPPPSSGLNIPKPPNKQKKKKTGKKVFPAQVAVKQKLEKALENGEFEEFAKEYSRIAKEKRQEEMKKNKGKLKMMRPESLPSQPWLSRAPWILSSVLWPLNRLFCLFSVVVITTMLLSRPIRCLTNQVTAFQESNRLLCLMESGFLEGLQYHELLYPEGPNRLAETLPIASNSNNQNKDTSENSPTFITTHVWFDLLFFLQVFLFVLPRVIWNRFQWRMKIFKLGGFDGDAVHLDDLKEKWAAYRMVEVAEDEGINEPLPLNPEAVFQATFDQADLLLERVDRAENIKEDEDSEEEKKKLEFARLWNGLVSEAPFDESHYRQKKALVRQADLWLLKKQVDYFCQSKLPVCLPAALSSSTSISSSFFPHSDSILTPTFLLESVAARSHLTFSISFVLLLQLASISLLATFWDIVLSRSYLPGGQKTRGSFYFLGFRKAKYLFEYYFSAPNEWIGPDPAEEFFPRLIKCVTPNFGLGGGLETPSSLCVIFANIFVEAVVLLLWAFYLLAAPALVAALLWDLLPSAVPALRRRHLRRLLLKKAVKRAGGGNEAMVAEVLANVHLVSQEVALYVHYLSQNVGQSRAAVVLFNYILSKVVAAQLPATFASSCSAQSAQSAQSATSTFSETSSFDEQLFGELQQLRAALKKKKLVAAKKFLSTSAQVDRFLERLGLRTSSHEVPEGEERQGHLETSSTSADSGVQVNSAHGGESMALFIEQLSTEKVKKLFDNQLAHEFAQVGEGYSGNIILKR